MATIEEVLASNLARGVHIQLESTPDGLWRCRVKAPDSAGMRAGSLRDLPWTSLHPAHNGHVTPLEAVLDTDSRATALLAARGEAIASEVLHHLKAGRLAKRPFQGIIPGEDAEVGMGVDVWIATSEDGTIESPGRTPEKAIHSLKESVREALRNKQKPK